jgi:hypothetical protein
MLAKLHEEMGGKEGLLNAAECVRRFLEVSRASNDQKVGWDELARLYCELADWSGALQAIVRSATRPGAAFNDISFAANSVNNMLSTGDVDIEAQEKRLLIRDLVSTMAKRIDEGYATDRSRLAWLYLRLQEDIQALEHARRGLEIEPTNEHCTRLVERLSKSNPYRASRE